MRFDDLLAVGMRRLEREEHGVRAGKAVVHGDVDVDAHPVSLWIECGLSGRRPCLAVPGRDGSASRLSRLAAYATARNCCAARFQRKIRVFRTPGAGFAAHAAQCASKTGSLHTCSPCAAKIYL